MKSLKLIPFWLLPLISCKESPKTEEVHGNNVSSTTPPSSAVVLSSELSLIPVVSSEAQSQNYNIVKFQMPKSTLSTSYGDLSFVFPEDVSGDYTIFFRGKKVFEVPTMRLYIPYHIKSKDAEIFLVTDLQGGLWCPEMHYWFKVDKSGFKITEDFTECLSGENIKVTQKEQQIRFEIDAYGDGGHISYCMNPKTLKSKRCS